MDEQRYVVVITRPVPPEKVAQVAQRIAERLNVPVERIVTLLDGRVGEVTKPVLADKADAITEVFAEAGVSVVIDAARIDPPAYRERFGDPNGHGSVTDQASPDAADHDYGYGEEPDTQANEDLAPEHAAPGYEAPLNPEPQESVQNELPEEPPAPESAEEDDVPWGQDGSWGFDADAAQQWSRQQDEPHADSEPEDDVGVPPIQPPTQPPVQPDELSADSFSDEDFQPYESQEDSYDGPYEEPYDEPYEEPYEEPHEEGYDQPERQVSAASTLR